MSLFDAFGAASLAAGVRVEEGFIHSEDDRPRRRLIKPTVFCTTIPHWDVPWSSSPSGTPGLWVVFLGSSF